MSSTPRRRYRESHHVSIACTRYPGRYLTLLMMLTRTEHLSPRLCALDNSTAVSRSLPSDALRKAAHAQISCDSSLQLCFFHIADVVVKCPTSVTHSGQGSLPQHLVRSTLWSAFSTASLYRTLSKNREFFPYCCCRLPDTWLPCRIEPSSYL